MPFKLTGCDPPPSETVTIGTTVSEPGEALRIAEEWTRRGVGGIAITTDDGHTFSLAEFAATFGRTGARDENPDQA